MHVDRHPSSVPGDLVRDRKTQADYIIQGLEAATVVGMVTVKLVDVITSRTREEVLEWEEIQRRFLTIRPNTRRMQPSEALSEIRQLLKKGLGDENLFQQLAQEENAPLRDMLYISGSVTENTFSQGIVQFAQSVITSVGGKPNKDSIYQIFRQSVPESSATDEFLMSVAERVHSVSDLVGLSLGKGQSLTAAQNQGLVEFFASGEYQFARNFGLLSPKFKVADLPDIGREEGRFLGKLLKGGMEARSTFNAFPMFNQMPRMAERERSVYVVEEITKAIMGSAKVTPMFREVVRRRVREAERLRKQSKLHPLYQQILMKSKLEEAKAGIQDMTQLQQMRLIEDRLYREDLNIKTHRFFPDMSRTVRRARNWDQFGLDYSAGLGGVDWKGLRKHIHDRAADGQEMLSITHESFLSQLIGERGFRLRGRDEILHLSDPEHSRALQEALGIGSWNKSGSLLAGRAHMRNLLDQREEDMVLDLANVLHDSRIAHSSISVDDLATIRESHYTSSGARSIASKSSVNLFGVTPSARGAGLHKIGDESVLSNTKLPYHTRVEKYLQLKARHGHTRVFGVYNDQGDTVETSSLRELFAYINANPKQFKKMSAWSRKGIMYQDVLSEHAVSGIHFNRGGFFRPIAENLGEGDFRHPGAFVKALAGANTSALSLNGSMRRMQGTGGGVIEGRASYKVAVAKLSSSSNNIEFKILGTKVPGATPQGQLELSKQLYGGNSLIVDIETRLANVHKPSSLYLRQIAWGTSEHDVQGRTVKNSVEMAQSIIEFARSARGRDVVASHGDFDPVRLLEFARRLETNPQVVQQGLAKDLIEARQVIEGTLADGRWLDLTFLHGLRTGESQSRVNQAYLQIRYLNQNRIERHTARTDVQDAWKLAMQGHKDIMHNAQTTQMHVGGSVADAGMMVMETDQMGNNYGRILKVTHVDHQEFLHELGGPGFVAHVQELASDGHHGVPYKIVAENQYALSARIAQRGVAVDENALRALRPEYNAMLNERSLRELRDLFNPNRLMASDSQWNSQLAEEFGSYGVYNARMRSIAIQLRSGTDPSYYRMLGDKSIAGSPQGSLSRFHAKYVEMEKLANANHEAWDKAEGIKQAAQSVVDEWLGSEEGQHLLVPHSPYGIGFMRRSLTRELENIELSPQYRAMLTDTEHSPYARVLGSEWAQTQVFDAFDGHGEKGLIWERHRAAQNIIHGTRLLSEEVSGARTIQTFGHRLSLEAGGVPISLSYSAAGGWAESGRALERIAPQVLQQAAMEEHSDRARAYISRVIENSGLNMSVEDVVGHVRDFKARMGDNFADLPAWKSATASMGFADHPLSRVVKAINLDEAGAIGTFKQGIVNRQRAIREMGATQEAEKIARYGDVLLDMIDAVQANHPRTNASSVHNVVMHDFIQQHGEEGMQFFLSQGADVDYTKIIDHPDLWRRASMMSNQVMDKVDTSTELALLKDEAAVAAKAEGLRGSDARVFESHYMLGAENRRLHVTATSAQQGMAEAGMTVAGSPLKDTVKRETHSAVSQAMGASQGGGNMQSRAEREALHELMTNASILRSMRVPLLAAGGVVALMAARTPTDDGFTMGNVSKGFGVGQPYAARYSEIPGSDKSRTVWDGDASQFQLDITFEGFVKRKEDMEALQRHVYDTVAGMSQVQVRNTQVDDNRERSHVQNARNMLRRNI